MNLFSRNKDEPLDPETAHRLQVEEQMRNAADDKRKQCKHINAVEVTNRELGRVAWWCEECETQLPAEWEKPVNGWGRPITGTPFLVQSPLGVVEMDTVRESQRKRSEQGFILHQTAVGQPVEPLRPAVQDVWKHHMNAEEYAAKAAKDNAEYFAALQARIPGIERGWTVQQHTECPPEERLPWHS